MGFTTSDKCYEDLNMPQTPENLAKVLDRAGWNIWEASERTGVQVAWITYALNGRFKLDDGDWKKILNAAGRRVFDDEA